MGSAVFKTVGGRLATFAVGSTPIHLRSLTIGCRQAKLVERAKLNRRMEAAALADLGALGLPARGALEGLDTGVAEARVLALMGVKGASGARLERQLRLVREAAERSHGLLRPAAAYSVVPVTASQGGGCVIVAEPPARLSGRYPAERLAGCVALLCLVTTVGPAIDEAATALMEAGDFPLAFALETYGVAAVNAAMVSATRRLRGALTEAGWRTTAPVMPGFRGWDVADQATVARLAGCEAVGVSVTEGGMLQPLKSKSAVIGLRRASAVLE